MAEVTWFGTEQYPCSDPNMVGCGHPIGIHDGGASGCSHIGPSGWCLCGYEPRRSGAAALLAESVVDRVGIVGGKTPPRPSPAVVPAPPALVHRTKTFKVSGSTLAGAPTIKCKALVYVNGDNYRACRKIGEFQKWVPIPSIKGGARQVQFCFTHLNAKEVVFEL